MWFKQMTCDCCYKPLSGGTIDSICAGYWNLKKCHLGNTNIILIITTTRMKRGLIMTQAHIATMAKSIVIR